MQALATFFTTCLALGFCINTFATGLPLPLRLLSPSYMTILQSDSRTEEMIQKIGYTGYFRNREGTRHGSGVQVCPKVVLTVNHVIKNRNVGGGIRYRPATSGRWHEIASVEQPPGVGEFNENTSPPNEDIALVVLRTAVPANTPMAKLSLAEPENPTLVRISGFGNGDYLPPQFERALIAFNQRVSRSQYIFRSGIAKFIGSATDYFSGPNPRSRPPLRVAANFSGMWSIFPGPAVGAGGDSGGPLSITYAQTTRVLALLVMAAKGQRTISRNTYLPLKRYQRWLAARIPVLCEDRNMDVFHELPGGGLNFDREGNHHLEAEERNWGVTQPQPIVGNNAPVSVNFERAMGVCVRAGKRMIAAQEAPGLKSTVRFWLEEDNLRFPRTFWSLNKTGRENHRWAYRIRINNDGSWGDFVPFEAAENELHGIICAR